MLFLIRDWKNMSTPCHHPWGNENRSALLSIIKQFLKSISGAVFDALSNGRLKIEIGCKLEVSNAVSQNCWSTLINIRFQPLLKQKLVSKVVHFVEHSLRFRMVYYEENFSSSGLRMDCRKKVVEYNFEHDKNIVFRQVRFLQKQIALRKF